VSPEWVTAIGTAMMGTAAWVASWAGIRGLDAWRAEAVGRRKAELAEEVLAQFYRIRDVIAWARLPSHRSPVVGESAASAADRRKAAAQAPVERLAAESKLFSELQASRYRFMAYFGQDAAHPFEEIRAIHAEIIDAAGRLSRSPDHKTPTSQTADHKRWGESLGWGDLDADALGQRLDRAIRAIERICRPLIEEPTARSRRRPRRDQAVEGHADSPGAVKRALSS
jgi:hypothetical protein